MNADERQVGGNHYKMNGRHSCEHWNYVLANDLDYFQAQITKYVTRWKNKNGLQDLEKALHFLEKYIQEMRVDYGPKEMPANPFSEEVMSVKLSPLPVDMGSLEKSRRDFEQGLMKMNEVKITTHPDYGTRKMSYDDGEPKSNGYVNQDGPYAR
jgi:hypothetical protein